MSFNLFKSKTFWGALIVAAAKIVTDPTPTGIAEAIGGVISVVGVRDAVAKNGTGK